MDHNNSTPATAKKHKMLKKFWRTDPNIPIPYRTIKRWKRNDPSMVISYLCQPEVSDTINSNQEVSRGEDNHANDNEETLTVPLFDMGDDADLSSSLNINRKRPVELLYHKCPKWLNESVFHVLNLYMSHKMTKKSLSHLLKTINFLLPRPNYMPKSVFKLFQYVQDLAPVSAEIKHYYCINCNYYQGQEALSVCSACDSESRNGVFYELDPIMQIKYLLEYRNLATILDETTVNDSEVLRDIRDGSEYKRVNGYEKRGQYDLTLILNTDGIALKKSSNADLWLLLCTFAEVPEHLRESFLIVLGVWYDKKKPIMNSFLRPICLKIRQYFDMGGFTWIHPLSGAECKSKILAPLIIADAPARALVQNILNFNGTFGCNICEIRTSRSREIQGKRSVNVYQFYQPPLLRTKERMQKQAKRTILLDKDHVKGVKGESIVSVLPFIDLSTCLVPEFMHSVCLGVSRQFLILWLEKPGPWNLKAYISAMNKFLLNIKPPNIFSRVPRSLFLWKKWKAYEFYYWLLFYSIPVIEQHMEERFVQHWICLVISIFTLNQREVSSSEIEMAEGLLQLFVRDIDDLYSDRELTYNVHQLLHLPLCVKRWGPLWSHSAFMFESFNGFITRMVHGSKHVNKEIINILKVYQGIQVLKYETENSEEKSECITVVGKPYSLLKVSLEDRNFINRNSLLSNYKLYVRVKIKKEVFTSELYKDDIKTNSFTVICTNSGGENFVGTIRFFVECNGDMYMVLGQFKIQHDKILYHQETMKKVKHILPIEEGGEKIVLRLKDLTSVVKLVRVGSYVCKRPNLLRKVL